jgi:hypothetical protein
VRYARIDLGMEIELPWGQITIASRKTGETIDETLGYHAVNGLFDRRDDFAKLDANEFPDACKDVKLLDDLFPRRSGAIPRPHSRLVDRFTAAKVKEPKSLAF